MATKDISEIDLSHIIEKSLTPAFYEKLGQQVKEMLRIRTRLGFGVESEGSSQKKLKPLAESTKKRRRRSKHILSQDTAPAKSNLTETGRLLDSIEFRVHKDGVEVFIDGSRNVEVSKYVSSERPFFNLSKTEIKRLADLIEAEIRKIIRK